MYDSKIIKKTIKNKLTNFVEKYNFRFLKPSVIIRENNNVLQIINFDIISGHFNCNIAIQPLYIPEENLILSFGNRLTHFKTNFKGSWGYGDTQDELDRDFDKVVELLEENVIDWFNEVNTARDIITFINNMKIKKITGIVMLTPEQQDECLGFSYLYEGEYKLAHKLFEKLLKIYENKERVEWFFKDIQMSKEILNMIENTPEKISNTLNEYIEFTKENLKLK